MTCTVERNRHFGGFFQKAAAIFLILSVAVIFSLSAQQKLIPVTSANGVNLSIPVKDLGFNAAFYTFKTRSNVTVRFFAILDRDNKVHVAFDACDVCYQAKKGYRVVNGLAICNNCGNRYSLKAIGTDNIAGGCWPSYLPIKVANGAVEIQLGDIEKKKYLFQ